jgi:hypothetical protein
MTDGQLRMLSLVTSLSMFAALATSPAMRRAAAPSQHDFQNKKTPEASCLAGPVRAACTLPVSLGLMIAAESGQDFQR